MKKWIQNAALLLLLTTLNLQPSTAFAQGTAFAYQGQLDANGGPATGIYDLRFTIYDAVTNGNLVAGPLTNSATGVTNGLFTVTVDFGPGVFTGPTRWLELDVQTNGGNAFTTLLPLQPLLPVPYAIFAGTASNLSGTLPAAQLSGTVSSANLSGTYGSTVTLTNAGNSFSGNGAGLGGVNAALLEGLAAADFWQTAGNTGTSPTNGNFLGTTDNQPLELWVNAGRALRLEPGVAGEGAPNVIGGSPANFAAGGIVGATIGGGGATNYFGSSYINSVTSDFGTVGGGGYNTADYLATVGGGYGNSAGYMAAVGGGTYNNASGGDSTVGGGQSNTAQSSSATVGGGQGNNAQGNNSTVGGGIDNSASGVSATVAGGGQGFALAGKGPQPLASFGAGNSASGDYSSVGGGRGNQAGGLASTVAGGDGNVASVEDTAVGGGQGNTASGDATVVSGGYQNAANGDHSVVGGGQNNTAYGAEDTLAGGQNNSSGGGNVSTISGGEENNSSGSDAVIGGGMNNSVSAVFSTIGGGVNNFATNMSAVVSGGTNNVSGGYASTVPGGDSNVAAGDDSLAAGSQAQATNNNSFVWGDGSAGTASTTNNQFVARAMNGFVFYTATDGVTGVSLAPGATAWATLSDRNAKKDFAPVDTEAVLDRLASVPVEQWRYKWEPAGSTPNIGPMAQDFISAFYPGRDDRSITTLEFDGVELAAIQGLNRKLNEKDAEIQELEARLDRLEQLVETKTGGGK